MNGLASAISRITAKNGTVAIRHLAVKGKVNMDPVIGLCTLQPQMPAPKRIATVTPCYVARIASLNY